jgi:ankyrin repeat protein
MEELLAEYGWKEEKEKKHSLLHEAVLYKSPRVVEVLLEQKEVDVNARDALGCTPLHWICWFCEDSVAKEPLDILAVLLQCDDLDINACDDHGYTALMFAADQQNEAAVRLLLEKGADPNHLSLAKTSALTIAAWHGSCMIAELLCEAGANLDFCVGEEELTPLMVAVKRDDVNLVVLFVKAGATVSFSSKAGTAKDLATSLVVEQFLVDSAYYQKHQKKKNQKPKLRISKSNASVQRSNAGFAAGDRSSMRKSSSMALGNVSPRKSHPVRISGSLAVMSPSAGGGGSSLKVFTSENHPLDLEYLTHPILGEAQIGMCMCPGRNKPKKTHIWRRDLQTDLQAIQDSGADVLVTLVRTAELSSMHIMEFFVRVKQMGIESLHFPVPDKWIPESMGEVVSLVEKILVWITKGKKIVIHW